MGPTSWIARVVRLAESVRARFLPSTQGQAERWSARPELRPDNLSVRRLEARRVLSASIQSLVVPAEAVEGDTVEVSAEATGGAGLAFDWTITRDASVIARGFTQDFSFQPPDDGHYDVSLTVTDPADQTHAHASATVDVLNAPPAILDLNATTSVENGTTTLTGTVIDPGSTDDLTLTIDWGDPSSPDDLQVIDLNAPPVGVEYDSGTGAFSIDHQYLDDNPSVTILDNYQVTVWASDDDQGVSSASTEVAVVNVIPMFEYIDATDVDENGTTVVSGKIVDPGTLETFTLFIRWGDGETYEEFDLSSPGPGVTFDPSTREFSVEHQFLDDSPTGTPVDPLRISVLVYDDDGGGWAAFLRPDIYNIAPTFEDLSATDVSEAGQTTLSGKIVDPGTQDTFTLEVDWGDGTVETFNYAAGENYFSETHTYADDNPTGTPDDLVTIKLTVTDDDTGSSSDEVTVKVTNLAPTVTGLSATATNENGKTLLTGVVSDPGTLDTHTLTINWGDPLSPGDTQVIDLTSLPTGATYNALTGVFSVEHLYLDDNPTGSSSDAYTIQVKVVDDDTGTTTASTTVTVTNIAPVLEYVVASDIDEDGTTMLSGTIVDPGTLDTFTLEVDWGDGVVETFNYSAGASSFFHSHQYLDDNPTGTPSDPYTIKLKVIDDDTGQGTAETTITVKNVAPKLDNVTATDVDEDGTTALSGSIFDPGTQDTFTLEVDWGDGNIETFSYAAGTTSFSESHQYLDDNPTATPSDSYTIKLKVLDDDTGQGTAQTTIIVKNVAPQLANVTANDVPENGVTTLSGEIVDPGTQDTFTLEVDWGDGTVETFNYAAGTTAFSETHTYLDDNPSGTNIDQYTIKLRLVDDDTGVDTTELTVKVTNVAPKLVDITANDVLEHGISNLTGRIDDLGTLDTFTLTVNWGDGVVEDYTTLPGGLGIDLLDPPEGVSYDPSTREFSIQHRYLDDNPTATPSDPYEIRLTLVDDDADMVIDAVTITVTNVAPVLKGASDITINEGETVFVNSLAAIDFDGILHEVPVQFSDVGTLDTHEAIINWGDGSQEEVLTIGAVGERFGLLGSHIYADDRPSGPYTVTVTVTDDDGGVDVSTFTVTVLNVDPTLTLVDFPKDSLTVNEGETLYLPEIGTFTDPGAANPDNIPVPTDETFYYTIDWGDGTVEELFLPVAVADQGPGVGKVGELLKDHSHHYADNDVDSLYTVTVTLHDDDGGFHARTFEVTVNNVNPTIEPLTLEELIDDPYMPGILADAQDLQGDGVTTFVLRFTDPGADTYEVWIDWGDKLYLSDGDPRFVKATPVNSAITEKGVTLLFSYPYAGPPDPNNASAPITITAVVLDDDYTTSTGGGLVFTPQTAFLTEPGRSDAAEAVITNPGIDEVNVAIDTTPDIAVLEFPALDEFIEPPLRQSSADAGQQTQGVQSSGGDSAAVSERVWVLRTVSPDGQVGEPVRLKPDAIENLPALFQKLDDGHYQILVIRVENNSERLVLDFNLRGGKPIDVSDDSDGARDRPPTSDNDQPDAAQPIEAAVDLTSGNPPNGNLLSTAGLLAVAALKPARSPKPTEDWRDEVERALATADQKAWNRLLALRRRRPR